MSHHSLHLPPPQRYPHRPQSQSHHHLKDSRRAIHHNNPTTQARGTAQGHHLRQSPHVQSPEHRDIQIEELSDRESTPVYQQPRPIGKFTSHGYEGNRNITSAQSMPMNHPATQPPLPGNRGPAVQGSATRNTLPITDEAKAYLKARWEMDKGVSAIVCGHNICNYPNGAEQSHCYQPRSLQRPAPRQHAGSRSSPCSQQAAVHLDAG